MKRTLAMVVVDRANWGRLLPLAEAIRYDGTFDLQIICGGTTVLNRFKAPADDIEKAGFNVAARVFHEMEGSTLATMAQSIGLGVIQYTAELERIKPEFVITIGDRYEMLAATIAAAYTNRCIVHLQGGEVSGSIDESARHAISKLSHYHCPATEQSKRNLIRMGERPETVLSVGCPVSDLAYTIKRTPNNSVLVIYHPIPTAGGTEQEEMREILRVVDHFSNPEYLNARKVLLFWPNIDAYSDRIAKAIRVWRDEEPKHVTYITNLGPREYQQLLADVDCCIGNSSSFVRDAGLHGTPVVLVGNRQDGREHDDNVMHCLVEREDIISACNCQIGKRYTPSTRYGDGKVSRRILHALKHIEPYAQKRLDYTEYVNVGSITTSPITGKISCMEFPCKS